MQIAFFGMSLALPEAKTENGEPSCKGKQLPPPDLLLSGDEEEDDDYVFHRKVSNDKVIQLPSRLRAGSQTTIDSKKGDDSSDLLEDDEDLQAFRDLLPEGDKNLMDILISEGLDREAGSLTDALQGVKEEDEAKDSADDAIVGDLFDIDMVTEGLPHMDSQDVDDIFSGVLSPNGGSSGQEFHQPLNHMSSDVPLKRQLSEGHRIHLNPQMMPQGFPPPTLSYPNTMQGQVMSEGPRFPHLPPQMSHHSVEALPSMSPSIAARVPVPPAAVYPPPVSVQNQDWNQNNNSQDNDGEQTQGQKNIVKWEIDEALGELATISPVIYANLAHPNLKRDFPIWTERCKQIQKLWRQLPTPERQPYLLKARENRAASRVTKAQSESRTTSEPSTPPAQTIKTEGRLESDQERQWKQLQANRAVSNQEGRPELHAHFSDPGPSSHFESNIPGDASHRQGMLPPGVRPTNRPHMHSEGGQQPMKPSFEPLKIQGTFDPYSLPPGTPRPPIRPMGHQRFSPGASSSSPSTPMTPGDRPAFQSTPPHRPSSRDSFTGETANQQTPSSPQSQPKTPVASSPFHPSSPSVDHFAQTPSRPQSQPHAPFSPMTSHGVPSPARHQAGTPGSTPADFETSSPFARPPSLPGTPNEGFPSPQTSHVNSPLTPTEGNVTHHPLKASTSQHYDPNDPYSRPVMTPRPNTSTEGGFSRPIRPPVHQYPFQFNPQQQGQRRPERFIRPTSSDPYSHQPSTPMPSPAQDPYSNPPRTPMPFARQEEESSVGPRQQLRDLLQGQRKEPMRQEGPWMEGNRPRLPTPNQGFTVRAPSDGFRPPLPPSMRPPRLSHMSSGQFRHPGEPQRMMMQRLPFDPRMRQMLPPTPQMMPRHPQNPQQWQQQQQHGMRMSSPNDFIPQFNPQRHPMQHPSNGHPGMPPVHIQRPPFGQQIPQRHHEQSHGQHPQDNDTLTDNDPGLPDDIEDDELLGLGSDFNLLEYADPELDEALGVTDNKNLFDEHFPTKEPPKSSDCQGGHPQESSAPPPYPKQDEHHQPPPYSDQFTNQGPHQDMNPNQGNSLINDLDFENIKADLLGDDPVGNQQQMHPHYHVQNPHGNQMMFEGQQQQQPPQQWMNQQSMNPDPRFMQQQGGYPNQRFQGGPPSIPRMPVMVQRPQMPGPPPSQGHPALIQAMGSRPRQSLPKYQMPPMHPEPPFPVDEPITPQDHEVMANYRKWLFDQKALLDNEQRRIESEVARLRKIKKTINAKARQLKKTNQEISHQEAAELQQSINDLTMVMKGTEAIKKALRQHQITWENFDNKFKARGPLPPPGIMPQAMMNSPGSSMSSLPRSVSSPMISSAGPGTPSLPPSSTPQSPAHMSPSHVPPSPGNMMHSPHGSHSGHLSPGHAHAPNSPMIQSPVYQQRSPMMPHSGDFEQSGPPGGMRQPMSFQQSNHPPHRMPVGHQMGNHFQGMPRPGPHMNQTMMSPGGQRYPHPQQQMHGQQVFDPQQSQQFRNRHPNPEFSGDHVQNPGFHSSEQVYLRHPSQQMQFRPQFVSQQHSQQQPPVSQHLPISQAGQHSIHQMNHPHHQGPPQQQMYPQQHQFQHHHQMQQNTDFVQPNQERPMPESGNEDVEEAKTSMTLNFEEKGLGAESQAGNEALFQTEKNNDSSQVTENENSSQMIVTLVKSESICENDPHSQGNEAANSSLTGESMDFEEPFLSKQDLTITVIAPTIENSDESEEAKELERKRKNVLLKQLLQNCPSADPSATFSTIVVNTEPDSESIEISVERDVVSEEASVKQNEVAVVLVPASGDQLIQESSTQNTVEFLSDETATKVIINSGEIPHNELSNETAMEGLLEETSETRNQRPPPVERKMSYLDIRRALLEREPTPPPEAVVKPKRKRNPAKRKESKAVKEAAVIPTVSTIESTIPVVPTSSSSGSVSVTPTTTPPVKKRARKGSQIKAHSDDDHDALVSRVMTQLKKLPTMNVVEPKIKTNLNSVVPSGVGDLNTLSPIIRGCYGQGFIPVDDDRVSSISGQVHPVSSARAPLKGFYNQEFPGSTRVLNTIDYACILRETSSPDPFIPPSPETHLFREPDPRFSQVELTKDNDQKDQELKSPASPEIPSFIEIQEIDWDKMVSPPSSTDSDPDRDKENVLLSGSKVSGMYTPPLAGGPLKDSGNVAVTLTLSADAPDIKRVLGALAKLLEIEPPSEYQIVEHSQFGETKKETMDIKSEFPFCQSCDQRILNGEKKALPSSNGPCDLLEKDGKVFCSSPCLQRFCSSDNDVMDTFDAEQEDFKSIIEEKKIPELEEEPMELHQDLPEPSPPSTPIPSWSDEILSKLSIPVDPKVGIIDSRKWMGIKYHNWTPNLFEPSNPVEEENAEELAGLLESLDIVIKKENLPNDGRKCAFCHEIGDRDADGPARLLNYDVDKWVHLNCALWSTEVYETLNGALMSVDVALTKASTVSCVKCHKMGASIRCFKVRCTNVFHFACALTDNRCMFLKDKSFFCGSHAQKASVAPDSIMSSFVVNRRVYINRDDYKQLEVVIQDHGVMRIGSLVVMNIGQLLPTQLNNFHSSNCIFPVGYKVARFYWSRSHLGKRKKYICSIIDTDGSPEFLVEEQERGNTDEQPVLIARGSSPRIVWRQIVESVANMNRQEDHIKVFADQMTGEDLFGLTEQSVVRILESMQGVDTLQDYNFRYVRSQLLELPLAVNPSGCARTEPKLRTHFKRPHTMHTSNPSRSSLQSSFSSVQEVQSPYVKQFVHSKSSQYRKMKTEWRNNVYLARSRIAGLGLFAARDIEKHTMVIEYIGLLIRNELAERNERMYEQQVSSPIFFDQFTNFYTFLSESRRSLYVPIGRQHGHRCNPSRRTRKIHQSFL
jgi:histone-lysine N-methyltransferase MLL3